MGRAVFLPQEQRHEFLSWIDRGAVSDYFCEDTSENYAFLFNNILMYYGLKNVAGYCYDLPSSYARKHSV